MKINKTAVILITGFIAFWTFVTLTYENNEKIEKNILIDGEKAKVYSYYGKSIIGKKDNTDISVFFDGDKLTGSDKSIYVVFEKPFYVDSFDILINENISNNKKDTSEPDKLIGTAAYDNETMFELSEKANIKEKVKEYHIKINDKLLDILKVRSFYFKADNHSIQEIRINRRNKPIYSSVMSLNDIKKLYAIDDKNWDFPQNQKEETEENYENKYKVMLSLLTLALQGNKEAEKILNNYTPSGSYDSEMAYEYRHWLKMTQEWNHKD